MRLDALSVVIRPRHVHEAADLGIRFAAQNAGMLFRLWLLVQLPLLALALLLEHLTGIELAIAAVWWLKPVFDYVVLWFLSQAVFGDSPGWRQLPAAMPGFFSKGLGSALLWRRFSMSRAFVLPVWLLEGLRGSELRERVEVLRRQGTGPARMLQTIFAQFELIAVIMLLSLLAWFGPGIASMPDMFSFISSPAGTLDRDITVTLYALAVGMIEPLYVSAGFMLYLNRRTELEAWDVEIALRRLASRLPTGKEAA
jgi:hypothetical protein